jgi:hypothetical protein
MSFSSTGQVVEGDAVAFATFNQLKANIDAAFSTLGTSARNPGAAVNPEHGPYSAHTQNSCLSFFHRFRWLSYGSSGEIIDPTGIGATVTLTEGDGVNFYDLEGISWLTYGMYYRVEGVTWAQEYDIRM